MSDQPPQGFANNFVAMADNFGAFLAGPTLTSEGNAFVAFSDSAAATAVNAPSAPAEAGQAIADGASYVYDAAGNLVSTAASNTLNSLMPWLAVAAAVWLVVEVRRAR
jgi:hypothetical protein